MYICVLCAQLPDRTLSRFALLRLVLSGVWLHCFSNCFTGATNLNTNAPAPVCNNKIKCHSMPHVASCVGILSHTDGDTSRATARTWRRKSFKKLMPRTFQFVAPAFLPFKQLRGKCRWRWGRKDTLNRKELLSYTLLKLFCSSSDYAFSTAAFTGYFSISFAVAAQTALRAELAIFLAFMSKAFRLYVRLCDHVCLSVCLSVYALVCLSLGFQISGYLSRATVALTVLKSLKHATVQARSGHSNRQPKKQFLL